MQLKYVSPFFINNYNFLSWLYELMTVRSSLSSYSDHIDFEVLFSLLLSFVTSFWLFCHFSNSKEYADTKSLVGHTFYTPKNRALHLGFHRALCMLMGWKNKIAGGRKWFCELLSDSEASSLKEDHIIWPPVVIIHNSSLNRDDFDERVIVSIEALESILRGNA